MSDEGKTIDQVIEEEGQTIEVEGEITEIELVRDELGISEKIDPLGALLDQPDEAPTTEVYLKRLGTSFTVQAITDDRAYDKLIERCTIYRKNRRGGGRTRDLDGRRLSRLTVAEYTIEPAFHRRNGQESFEALSARFGSSEPEDLVDRALLMGEVDLLADAILELSGFDDEVETAGN